MDSGDLSLCPVIAGYCLDEQCPYWDQARQECSACFFDGEPAEPEKGIGLDTPCTIHWTEDFD